MYNAANNKRENNMKENLWYIVSTGDAIQLPLFYAQHGEDVAAWIGCSRYAIFTAFSRAKKHGENIIKVKGYTVERQELEWEGR